MSEEILRPPHSVERYTASERVYREINECKIHESCIEDIRNASKVEKSRIGLANVKGNIMRLYCSECNKDFQIPLIFDCFYIFGKVKL